MTARQIAGWALVVLYVAAFIVLGAMSGHWVDYLIGITLAAIITAATVVGMRFLAGEFRKGGNR